MRTREEEQRARSEAHRAVIDELKRLRDFIDDAIEKKELELLEMERRLPWPGERR